MLTGQSGKWGQCERVRAGNGQNVNGPGWARDPCRPLMCLALEIMFFCFSEYVYFALMKQHEKEQKIFVVKH